MFLKEMKYKLEQTEAAMKLADSADSSVNLSSNNFDTLPNRVSEFCLNIYNHFRAVFTHSEIIPERFHFH